MSILMINILVDRKYIDHQIMGFALVHGYNC